MITLFRSNRLTDVEVVLAVQQHNEVVIERFYHQCQNYFLAHARSMFIDESKLDDIFQDSIILLWREIETKRIVVSESTLCRYRDGKAEPMTSSLKTFLMAIAKRKNWEMLRREHQHQSAPVEAIDTARYAERPTDVSDDELAEQVVSDTMQQLTDHCREILTMFYYEQRSLDEILEAREENTSKIGLKTSKYKCINRLRQLVQQNLKAYGIRY